MNNYTFSISTILLLISLGGFISCGHDQSEHAQDDHAGHDHGPTTDSEDQNEENDHEEGEIHLTPQQMKAVGIQLGSFTEVKINDFISATGTLGLPPNAYSSVSAKTNGFIKNSNKYVEGEYVKKGTTLAYLENPDLIQQQQQYLEISAELVYLRQELRRQEELMEADAGILKNVQKLTADIQRKGATLNGLSKQMAYLGINSSQLTIDNIVDRIAITSPMSGYITTIDMHNGMYVTPQQELMEIISDQHLHLELDVFEKDLGKVVADQRISYTVPALGNTIYKGEVHVIGREFNTANKTVRIHGHLEKDRPRFVKDLFVKAKIWLNDQMVRALPEKAIIRDGGADYIYITKDENATNEIVFEKVMIVAGSTDQGFTAITLPSPLPDNAKVVTQGTYFVHAQSKVGSLEHNH